MCLTFAIHIRCESLFEIVGIVMILCLHKSQNECARCLLRQISFSACELSLNLDILALFMRQFRRMMDYQPNPWTAWDLHPTRPEFACFSHWRQVSAGFSAEIGHDLTDSYIHNVPRYLPSSQSKILSPEAAGNLLIS